MSGHAARNLEQLKVIEENPDGIPEHIRDRVRDRIEEKEAELAAEDGDGDE